MLVQRLERVLLVAIQPVRAAAVLLVVLRDHPDRVLVQLLG